MSVRQLDALLAPKSVAVIGASPRAGSFGAMVWQRVLDGGFNGAIWPVNRKYDALDGHKAYGHVKHLPGAPSVAVICTPPSTWPDIVHALGERRAAVAVLVGVVRSAAERAALGRTLVAAKRARVRLIGPGSLGVASGASRAHFGAFEAPIGGGGVAWISQSNALTNAVLGWARVRGLGFSHVIALGDEADVDAADMLDTLASDPATHAILLELDGIRDARKFMSAARAAARNKPVLALRTGRADPGDRLYTAAFQRAGVVRVDTLDELLDEIETLGLGRRMPASDAAALVASDAGLARLAVDALGDAGTELAPWPEATVAALAKALPGVAPTNPLLLGEDAGPERFATALSTLARYAAGHTVFVMHASSRWAPTDQVAHQLIEAHRQSSQGVLACFFGGESRQARAALHASGVPIYPTPQRLARAHARFDDYRLGREMLMQTPEGSSPQPPEAILAAQYEARAMLGNNRELRGVEASEWLAHFGLTAASEADRDVVLEIEATLYDDANFGPVFRYVAPSADGVSAPFVVYALPPFNIVLARAVVANSPYGRRFEPEPLLRALIAMSETVCEVRELVAMKLTLRVMPERVVIRDPSLRFAPGRSRLAIMPYPRRLEESIEGFGAPVVLRPIRPEDEAAHHELVAAMTPDDRRMRFFSTIRSFEHSQMARLTQIDYDREMALIASRTNPDGSHTTLGVVRAVSDPDNETAEFAVAVRADMKGHHLGRLLMSRIIDYARAHGTRVMVGEALRENHPMIGLARAVGFSIEDSPDDPGVVSMRLPLNP